MSSFQHCYSFDPSYGHNLESLRQILPPPESDDFAPFWTNRYQKAVEIEPRVELIGGGRTQPGFELNDIVYTSTDGYRIGGWLLTPTKAPVRRALLIGHGYGGRDGPDTNFPVADAAYLFPCFRGLSRSRREGISDNPAYHVLHDIDKPPHYLIGGCVEDVWVGISALLRMFPEAEGHIGYQGTSLAGGIGAMAIGWDRRIQRGALNVPTFGYQALRLNLPTTGSGDAVARFHRQQGNVMDTLRYYDAALAARHIRVPIHVAAALFDPVVAPPSQFAVYNALAGPKDLFVLDGGHFDYSDRPAQERLLFEDLQRFFQDL